MGAKICCDTRLSTPIQEIEQTPDEQLEKFLAKHPHIKQVLPMREETSFIKNRGLQGKDTGKGIYMGKQIQGNKSGFGIMMFHCGMYYEGQWENDLFNGFGKFIYLNGDFFQGNWKDGLPSGSGLYVSRDPVWRYEGDWEKGQQSGKGKEIFDDGSSYQGYFLNGVRHGKGKFRNHDGRFYEGSFVNGQVEGGAKACDHYFLYEGEWKNGKPNGAGKSIWQNEHRKMQGEYIGEYKQGRKHGFGEYREKEGVTFKGNWDDGYITNVGIIIQNSSGKKM